MKRGLKIKQLDATDCGAACLASVGIYYGLKMPMARIRQYAFTNKNGTTVLGMIEACKKLGLTGKGVMAEIEALDIVVKPVIAHVVIKKVYTHYIVIYKTTKKTVTYMDPIDGEFHTESKEQFKRMWSGVLILIERATSFVSGNNIVSNYTRFIRFVIPHKSMLFQALFGALITTMLGLSMSIYIGKITDYVLVYGNKNLLNMMSLIMIGILLIQIVIAAIRDIILLNTGQKIDTALILGYYQHLLKLPQQFFDTMRVGEIISRMGDATKIRSFINQTTLELILNTLTIIIAFCMMFIFSWKLTLVIFAASPLFAFSFYIFNKLNKKYQRKTMETAAELQSQLVESLNSIQTVKRFGLEEYSNIKTESRYVRMIRNIYASSLGNIFINSGNTLISTGVTIAVLWFGSFLVLDNALTPGTLLMFYTLINYVISPIVALISSNTAIQEAIIAADRLFQIMDLEQEECSGSIMELTDNMIGDIVFSHVCFRYGGRKEVFKDLNLIVECGKTTAIVGKSGSGKTTLASLLQNIYSIQEGRITIGGHEISLFSNESLRKAIAIVPQSVDLFVGSMVENIAVGEFQPNFEKVFMLIKLLGLEEFVNSLPDGLNTQISEHGFSISGGERQRIAIARSLYKDPKILILDEATSSLDSISENYVRQALNMQAERGSTIILIAHRLSTIRTADRIIVLENGKAVEIDTHDNLLKKKGVYYHLWNEQFGYYE